MLGNGELAVRRFVAPGVLSTDVGGRNTKAQTHDAFSGLVDSGRGGLLNSGRLHLTALPVAETTGRAYPRAEAREQGFDTSVILAHWPEESKGQNDLPQLPKSVQEIREGSKGASALPLLPVF